MVKAVRKQKIKTKTKIKSKPKIKAKTKVKAKAKTKKKIIKKIIVKRKIKKVVTKKRKILKKEEQLTKLKKHSNNPIIKPSYYQWESKATFNPSAFEANGKVYILYRAVGDNDLSVLGYASSYDGLNIEDRPTYAVYQRKNEIENFGLSIDYISGGGGNGGCEDPRLTRIGDTIYMLYTAFDGWSSVRIALTSIKLDDFKKKKWNWEKPILLSPPGEIQKSWVLFPEKINGKFAILHSISPQILIDYIDDWNDFRNNKFIESISHEDRERNVLETGIRGVGPSPIKTKLGWLVLYHAIEKNDPGRYKLFALVLDYKNPKNVIYRSAYPILEPEKAYENEGLKWGVIYSCGAVVKDGTLFVYYGGSDQFVCVASIELDKLLDSLKREKKVTLKNNKILK
ncbi:MAG: hypothetical protein KGI58_00670 [Patescibacteria group bacterium]|nr:hypothetical protein [Patescibacteria group bacterium]